MYRPVLGEGAGDKLIDWLDGLDDLGPVADLGRYRRDEIIHRGERTFCWSLQLCFVYYLRLINS